MWNGYLRRISRLLRVAFGPIPEPAQTRLVSNRRGRPRSKAPSFPHLETIAPGPPGFSKSYQDRHHEEACPAICRNVLPGHSTSWFSRSRQDSAGRPSPRGSQNCENCVQRLRPVGVMKTSSSFGASRRLREFTLLCADPTVPSTGTSAAHAPNGAVPVPVCLSHQRSRSQVNAS